MKEWSQLAIVYFVKVFRDKLGQDVALDRTVPLVGEGGGGKGYMAAWRMWKAINQWHLQCVGCGWGRDWDNIGLSGRVVMIDEWWGLGWRNVKRSAGINN